MFKSKKVDLAKFSRNDPWWKTTIWGKEFLAYEVVFLISVLSMLVGMAVGGYLAHHFITKTSKSNVSPAAVVTTKTIKPAVEQVEASSPITIPQMDLGHSTEQPNYLVPDIAKEG